MSDRVARAVDHLVSLQDGDRGVLETIACGAEAIPLLRHLLFEREPSGLYQPRCRAVAALAALGAQDVLIAFLHVDREIADPVESAGEDAVLNATARALLGCHRDVVFRRLRALVNARCLPGAIDALADFRQLATLPSFIDCLADDLACRAAEDAIRPFGLNAVPVLLANADLSEDRSESAFRMRRAILRLLLELADPTNLPDCLLADPLDDPDPACGVLRCQLALETAELAQRKTLLTGLVNMVPTADWRIRSDIAALLARYAPEVRIILAPMLPPVPPAEGDPSPAARRQRILFRLMYRLRARDVPG